jgi:NADH-quinone oxidoreductase subunit I
MADAPKGPKGPKPSDGYLAPGLRPETLGEKAYFPELIRGLLISGGHLLRNLLFKRDTSPDVLHRRGPNLVTTIQYPEEPVPQPPGYRGMHRLVPREDGSPRCVACYLCATVCPAQCIYIEAGEVEGDPIEKAPVRFEIDELRCIVCGFCVEACPKDAIRMDTGTHCASTYDRPSIIYGIDRLLKGPAVSHQSDVWFKREGSDPPPEGNPHPIPPLPGK